VAHLGDAVSSGTFTIGIFLLSLGWSSSTCLWN